MKVIITGAAHGLGQALATELRGREDELCLLDLAFTEPQLTAADGGWRQQFDVSDAAAWEALAATLEAQGWQPEGLVNNAGIGVYGAMAAVDPKDWERQLAVSLSGPWYSLKYLHLQKVMNIGSRRGLKAVAERTAYCAAKFGLRGFSLAATEELKGTTDVSIVELDSMLTNFTNALHNKEEREAKGEHFLHPADVAKEIADRLHGDKPWQADWMMRATADGYQVEAVTHELWE